MKLAPMLAATLIAAGLCAAQDFTVDTGTKVPLQSDQQRQHQTLPSKAIASTLKPFSLSLASGRIVVPVGSYVAGTVTQVKKPGRVKGRGELYVRFDSLTLPNGVTRDFHGRIGSMDGNAQDELDPHRRRGAQRG